jgi:hypothetical protein
MRDDNQAMTSMHNGHYQAITSDHRETSSLQYINMGVSVWESSRHSGYSGEVGDDKAALSRNLPQQAVTDRNNSRVAISDPQLQPGVAIRDVSPELEQLGAVLNMHNSNHI